MTINVGPLDRVLRALLGLVALYFALFSGLPAFDGALLKYGAILFGAVMLIVAAVRICPIYSLLGLKTCRM